MDMLEWAFARNLIKPEDYDLECTKLIQQYKAVRENIPGFDSLDSFLNVTGIAKCNRDTTYRE